MVTYSAEEPEMRAAEQNWLQPMTVWDQRSSCLQLPVLRSVHISQAKNRSTPTVCDATRCSGYWWSDSFVATNCVLAVLFWQIWMQLLLALDQWLMLSFHCTSQMYLELCTLLYTDDGTWIEATWPELISIYWCMFRDCFILPNDSQNHQM